MRTGTKRVVAAAMVGMAALGLAGSLWAQNTEVPERGFQPTGSYRLSDIETVNTKNGNVMLRVPLAALPPARGGNPGFQLTLNYNSKLWDVFVEHRNEHGPNTPNPPPGPGGPPMPPPPAPRPPFTVHRELRKQFADPGWHYSYDYHLEVEDRRVHDQELNTPLTQQTSDTLEDAKRWYVFKLWMAFPDGSVHLFRPAGEMDPHDDDYFRIRPNGWRLREYNRGWDRPSPGRIITYYSVGGSYLRLDFKADDQTVPDSDYLNWEDNPWTLYFPDGRRIKGVGRSATEILDRNDRECAPGDSGCVSNATTIRIDRNLDDGFDPRVEIVDEVGRKIIVDPGAGPGGADEVRQRGHGGEELTWTIHQTQTKVWREYITNPDMNDQMKDFVCESLTMVGWIQPPAELGGSASHRYEFGYNGNAPGTPCSRDTDSSFQPPLNPSTGLGEIASVRVPSGATATYRYVRNIGELGSATMASADAAVNNAIVRKVVGHDGETETWVYGIEGTPPGGANRQWYQTLVTAPDGGKVRETYNLDGLLQKVERLKVVAGVETIQTVIERDWAYNQPAVDPSPSTMVANPYVEKAFATVATGTGTLSQTAIKTFAYDQNGNLTELAEYDWVGYTASLVTRDENGNLTIPSMTYPKRVTRHTYHRGGPTDAYHKPTSPRLKTARASTEILGVSDTGSETRQSYRKFTYDNARTTGNLTEERIWDSTRGTMSNTLTNANSIRIAHGYDARYGNRTLTTDGEGRVTRWTYGSRNLYPVTRVVASGTPVARTTNYTYDFPTGAVISVTDADNGVTTQTTLDAAGRPILVKEASGKSEERHTATWYCDAQQRLIVRSDLSEAEDGKQVTVTNYDQMGRVSQTRSWESGAPPMPSGSPGTSHCGAYGTDSDSDRDVIKVKTHYQSVKTGPKPGRYTWTSNPYRETGEDTAGWTRTRADGLGRVLEVALFSGDSRPSTSGTGTLGTTVTAYDAEYTTATDPAGKKRRSRLDGLGRLVRVDEPDSNGSLGSTGSPVQATSYSYDALGNLIRVSQGSQTRSFAYDSLGRLTSATNPESGTTSYRYDANGNLTGKTDARSVVTAYSYDRLDRLTRRAYSHTGTDTAVSLETTRVDYAYDNCGAYSQGRLCSVTASKDGTVVSRTAYNRYDALGRVLKSTQTTGETPYRMAYAYDRAGNLVSQTYPSGKVIKTVYDGAGRVAGVKRQGGSWYAGAAAGATGAIGYEPHGGIRQFRLGNLLWEQRRYNRRLQPTQIGLGTVEATGDTLVATATGTVPTAGLLLLNYSYGTTANNGNVVSQQIQVGDSLDQTQTYTYDKLNRLKTATETGSGTGWMRTYQYDRYGNRAVTGADSYLPMTDQALTPRALTAFNASSNRLLGGAAYDGAGNLTLDWGGRRFKYDGDNRMVSFDTTGVNTDATYQYDGEGRRVKRVVGGVTTTYVYNVLGQLVAEYASRGTPLPGIRYLTTDHLGSTRVVTQAVVSGPDGGVVSRHDYLPFGEEIGSLGGRTTALKYSASGPAQKFTGKERDNESGLDYFQARYFSGAAGRFTSVDPENAGSDPADPQSWNGYAYARNNPLLYIDPTGETFQICPADVTNTTNCPDISNQQYQEQFRQNETFIVASGKIYARNEDGTQGALVGTARETGQDLSADATAILSGLEENAAGSIQLIGVVAGVSAVAGAAPTVAGVASPLVAEAGAAVAATGARTAATIAAVGPAARQVVTRIASEFTPQGRLFTSSVINQNRYLRIGFGRKGGERVFRIGGEILKKLTGKSKIDLFNLGRP